MKNRKKRIWTACILCILIICGNFFCVDAEEPTQLYAQSAVLMDADSGRILFTKNGQQERPMASTTKIMTCILALEYGDWDSVVTASANACAQPKVHLGVTKGETFLLRDLMYSLMLESHNDTAVMIAENVGGSVQGFADMMNAKAKELGCDDTYFITPNGLDSSDETGAHHTTAEDLARIMKYCIMDSPQKDKFLEVTRTSSYQFSDCGGLRSFSCTNHNAFLQMMEGALSGKTGFTADAGYCYVGALRRDDRTFIVALLACGWPNNKSYKWSDAKALMTYGIENYEYRRIWQPFDPGDIPVIGGVNNTDVFNPKVKVPLRIVKADPGWQMLLRKDEKVQMEWNKSASLLAPIVKGEEAGQVTYSLNGDVLRTFRLETAADIEKKDFFWCVEQILAVYWGRNSSIMLEG